MCENYGQSCEECLRSEVTKKLGDDGTIPHFNIQRIYLHSKPVLATPPPQQRSNSDVTVFFTHRRPGEVYGPYLKLGAQGRLITRERAEKLIGSQLLVEKIERARQTATTRSELSKSKEE
jgi:hypothetical protein